MMPQFKTTMLATMVAWTLILGELRTATTFHALTGVLPLSRSLFTQRSCWTVPAVGPGIRASKLLLRDSSDSARDARIEDLERDLRQVRKELADAHTQLREAEIGNYTKFKQKGLAEVAEVAELWSVVSALTANPMSEGGCPWTAEQGALDIIEHARSEIEEIADELRLGNSSAHNALQSELGDMLFNTLLLIRVCQRDELGNSTLAGAAAFAAAKIRRRAPFVFGDAPARPMTPQEATEIWKKVKQLEKVGLIKDCPVGYEQDEDGCWECKPVQGTQYAFGDFKSESSGDSN